MRNDTDAGPAVTDYLHDMLGVLGDILAELAAIRNAAESAPRAPALTEHDRDVIGEARRIGPGFRAGSADRDRLAGWLLADLADIAERLGGAS